MYGAVNLGVGEHYPCESVRHTRNVASILVVSVHSFLHKIYCRYGMSGGTTVVRFHFARSISMSADILCEDARTYSG